MTHPHTFTPDELRGYEARACLAYRETGTMTDRKKALQDLLDEAERQDQHFDCCDEAYHQVSSILTRQIELIKVIIAKEDEA
ncbi:MAG: hypothetical protein CML68_13560 [Rhodobacteraceae bacterium]|nr:hypothetical protein [Paracoccaceae bacterium]